MKNFVTVFAYILLLLCVSLVIEGCDEAKKSEAPQDIAHHDTLQEEVYQDAADSADAGADIEVEVAEPADAEATDADAVDGD